MQLKMKVGLSGPERSLAPGDQDEFDDVEGQRLVDAGFAELVPEETAEERLALLKAELAELEPPVEETPEQRIARLKAELAELEPPVEEAPEERIARLEAELAEAKAALPQEPKPAAPKAPAANKG